MLIFRHRRWACAPAYATCDSGTRSNRRDHHHQHKHLMYHWHSGRMFGVRRPLRYLSWKLDLSEQQIRDIADVLNRLKTARAQARVDWEKSVADIADTFSTTDFDEEKAKETIELRKHSAAAQQEAILEALRRLHAILDEDQRADFVYLLRSGGLEI